MAYKKEATFHSFLSHFKFVLIANSRICENLPKPLCIADGKLNLIPIKSMQNEIYDSNGLMCRNVHTFRILFPRK